MKFLKVVIHMAVLVLILNQLAISQGKSGVFKTVIIEPCHLTITTNKTTNLIFPYTIVSVDRGSGDVLAQKATGVENVLHLKAGKVNFAETNLSVITADGTLYPFTLAYNANPSLLNISVTKDTSADRTVPQLQTGNNEAELKHTAERIVKEKRKIHVISDNVYGIKFRLNGIYIKEDIVFFQLEIKNNSKISYDIDMLRFFIRDDRRLKRTATQETEIYPLHIAGDTSGVKEQSHKVLAFAMRKFTIPDRKYLSIQLMEKYGGRHLRLRVFNRTIIKASQAPK